MDHAYGRLRETGYMSPNRWLVMMFPNERVRSALGMEFVPDVARLATTCKSMTINDKSWYTTEENFISAGSNRIFPYKRNTNNSSGMLFQFNCGSDMFEKEFFDGWYSYLQNPVTKQWKFYDDYAKGSEVYIMLLPKHVRNFDMAMEAMYQGKITGIRLTEVYPYRININGGSLNYGTSTDPMTIEVGMMYHDMVPLKEINLTYTNILPTITDTGFPVIDNSSNENILRQSQYNLNKAVGGFIVAGMRERANFDQLQKKQRSILEAYSKQLAEYKNENFPRAVDGRVVYQTPRQGGLDLGLTLLSQTQGFFGAGFFG